MLGLAAVAGCTLAGCTVDAGSAARVPSPATSSSRPSATTVGALPDAAGARDRLSRLPVRPERDGSTYRRRAFGSRWADVDGNGCDTRDDVLARDLLQVRRRGRCVVLSGLGTDAYTGQPLRFDKARADLVQVDHVVALAEAWRSGAEAWTDDRRLRYANDPGVLVLTSRSVNAGKGDQDAGTWAPADRGAACRFALRVVAVKTAWGLAVDARERAGLLADLALC